MSLYPPPQDIARLPDRLRRNARAARPGRPMYAHMV